MQTCTCVHVHVHSYMFVSGYIVFKNYTFYVVIFLLHNSNLNKKIKKNIHLDNTNLYIVYCILSTCMVFSSPEPKAQVSYCRPFSSVVRRPSSVNFLHFHLLTNAWLHFNQTWQESSLGVGDSKLFKSYVWPPWGPRGRAPKGQNHANFKHLLLQIQKENVMSSYVVCRYLIRWRIKVVHGSSQGGPNRPLWALCKK